MDLCIECGRELTAEVMLSTGVDRKVDDLGRIVLPKEIRDPFGLNKGSKVELYINNGFICIKPHESINTLCGIIREIDELGRVVIPIETRRMLNIKPKTQMAIVVYKGEIYLRPHYYKCVFCGGVEGLVWEMGICFCKPCIIKMAKQYTDETSVSEK